MNDVWVLRLLVLAGLAGLIQTCARAGSKGSILRSFTLLPPPCFPLGPYSFSLFLFCFCFCFFCFLPFIAAAFDSVILSVSVHIARYSYPRSPPGPDLSTDRPAADKLLTLPLRVI